MAQFGPQTANQIPFRSPYVPEVGYGMNHKLIIHKALKPTMLVIFENGEQRLIKFLVPSSCYPPCTVREILELVKIKVHAGDKVVCIENPGSEIEYIVKIGNLENQDTKGFIKAAEHQVHRQKESQKQAKEMEFPPSKFIYGFYAVCKFCGFYESDYHNCSRCYRLFFKSDEINL